MDPLARSIFPLPETKEGLYETWHDIVEEYTNRSLTYLTDRLPANSSSSGGGCTCRSVSSEYIAPTFSWASITNPVCCHLSQPGWTPRCVVLDANCEVVTDANPLGRVKSGFVTLRGHLLKSTLINPYNGKGDLYYTQPAGWEREGVERLKVYPDQLLEEVDVPLLPPSTLHHKDASVSRKGQVKVERSVRRVRRYTSGKNCPPPHRARTGSQVCLFLLGHTPGSRINERVNLAVCFILLGLSTDHPGKFERVSLATGEVEKGKLEELLLRLPPSKESVVTVI